MTNVGSATLVRALGWAAVTAGIAAALAGSPYSSRNGRIDVDALSSVVQHEDDHVTAVELAAWIRSRRPGLRVIDVRSAAEYDAYHVPTAERVSLDSIAHAAFRKDETIVIYSEGGAHAAQAWVFLRALGHDRVFFLRGGLYEWLDDVMSPTLARDATMRDSIRFDSVAALSRYFGGVPRRGVASALDDALPVPARGSTRAAAPRVETRASSTSAAVQKVRRRGC
jgi:rhodanese-related sulfurtransferase